jgi:hypothetical protein
LAANWSLVRLFDGDSPTASLNWRIAFWQQSAMHGLDEGDRTANPIK